MIKSFFVLFFFSATVLFSQQTIAVKFKNTPLKKVILTLEKETKINFSYVEELIASKKISLTTSKISIAQLLIKLANQTQLNFEKVAKDQIIVSASVEKMDACGYLFDINTNLPLSFATIWIEGTTKGVITDKNGYFKLEEVLKSASIKITYLGYQNKSINAADYNTDDCKNIFLIPEVELMKEVIIQGYIATGIAKNSNGSLSINNKELGLLPGLVEPDVLQNIQRIPGVNSLNESVSGIQIRGGSADQNLIYFDGIKMYNTGHFFGMLSVFNPYVIENTKIYKGGASPAYGDRISGVIEMNSRSAIPKVTSGGFGINGTQLDGYLETHVGDKVGIVTSLRRSYTDIIQTPTFNGLADKVFQNTRVRPNFRAEAVSNGEEEEEIEEDEFDNDSEFFFYDGNIKLMYTPTTKDRISISGLFTNNDLNFFTQNEDDRTQDRLTIKNQGVNVDWEKSKGDNLKFLLKGYYSGFESNYGNSISEEAIIEENNLRKNTVEELGANLGLETKISGKHNIKAGYQFSKSDVFFRLSKDFVEEQDANEEPEGFNEIKDFSNYTNALYTEFQYKLPKKGFSSIGFRGSKYSIVDGFFVEPRINIEYPITSKLRVKSTLEKRYQAISQIVEFEDTQLRLENQIWTLADDKEAIPILESNQFSLGFFTNVGGWAFDIDGYYKNIKGLTSFTRGFTNANEGDDFSEGKSAVFGMDFLVQKKIKNYSVWASYTYNKVAYTFKQLSATSFAGNNDITHNFRISNTVEFKKWEASLGWNFHTGAPFTPVENFNTETGDIVFGEINSSRLPNYHRLDASFLYKFDLSKSKTYKGTLGLSLQNLYARKTPLSILYQVNENQETGEEELNQIKQLSLSFTPNIVFRCFF